MSNGHEIHGSTKSGINSKESYIVTRGRTSFLRIIGQDPKYLLMTATASEDRNQFTVCSDKPRLISAAWKFGLELNTKPSSHRDRADREYVLICEINLKPGSDPAKDREVIDSALDRFFEIFDSSETGSSEQAKEMREVYEAIAPDSSGDEVYLSDGLWLARDGTLHDRGR